MKLRKSAPCRARTALLVVALIPWSGVVRSHAGESAGHGKRLAFLSTSGEGQPPGEIPPPPPDVRDFDGRWMFTSAGCKHTGSLVAIIRSGRIIVRGGSGQVEPDGTLHSVGAGGGMTLTAEGHLSGGTGSGTFDRSDGCTGTWIAIKRRR